MDGLLRDSLIRFVKAKFFGYPNVSLLADDIVHEAYICLLTSRLYTPDKENFGYLSVVCLRIAYRQFMSQSQNHKQLSLDIPDTMLISEPDFAAELLATEDAQTVLKSLATLREIERIVITQRYYGDFSFAEIAEANDIKLNTVLSHHRRALEKLRPKVTRMLGLGKENYFE